MTGKKRKSPPAKRPSKQATKRRELPPPATPPEMPPSSLVRALRLAVQRALRDYEPGAAECMRRWFAAERTGASPTTIEYGYPQDPAFWVHRAGTPDAVCVAFYGEPNPDTMHAFGR